MKRKIYITLAGLVVTLLALSSQAMAYTNPPLPYATGVTQQLCDVRNGADYGSGEAGIDQSLRNRIDLFNAETSGGAQSCVFGIYFLDPYAITLKQPLKILGLQHPLDNGKPAGTYISGADQAGKDMGTVINGFEVTDNTGSNCAVMIEGGLASFQQIHDLTIIATSEARAICDTNGVDLRTQTIPANTARTCPAGALAKDCDFKGVNVVVKPATPIDKDGDKIPDTSDLCPNDAGPASNGGCPTNTTCLGQTDGKPHTKTGVDADGDGIDQACDSDDTPAASVDEPTCTLSVAPSGNGYDLTWTTNHATAVTLSDGKTDLSTDWNPATPLHVVPTEPSGTIYTLKANGAAGTSPCVKTTELFPQTTVVKPSSSPTCDLVAVTAATGFNLTWTSMNGSSASLTDGKTVLSTSLNSSGPVNVDPATPTTYTFTVMGVGGSCSKSIVLTRGSPVPTSPTCGLNAATHTGGGYDLNWTTTNATTASLSDGSATPLSTSLNSTKPLTVTPTSATIYTLTANASGGHCVAAIVLPPGAVPPPPTCELDHAVSGDGFDLTWTSKNGMTASLTDDTNVLSTDNNSSAPVHVKPTSSTNYTLTVAGLGGVCSRGISLGGGDGPVVIPTCDLAIASSGATGFDLAWTSANATTVSLSDGSKTLSTDPQSASPIHVAPAAPTFYILTASNSDGLCSRGILLSPPIAPVINGLPDTDGDGIPDNVETINGTKPDNPDTDGDGICDGPNTVKDTSGTVVCTPFNGHQDNCPLVSNGPLTADIKDDNIQLDSNGDGVGDVCQVLFDIQGGGGCSLIMTPGDIDMAGALSGLLTLGIPMSLVVLRKKKK